MDKMAKLIYLKATKQTPIVKPAAHLLTGPKGVSSMSGLCHPGIKDTVWLSLKVKAKTKNAPNTNREMFQISSFCIIV